MLFQKAYSLIWPQDANGVGTNGSLSFNSRLNFQAQSFKKGKLRVRRNEISCPGDPTFFLL